MAVCRKQALEVKRKIKIKYLSSFHLFIGKEYSKKEPCRPRPKKHRNNPEGSRKKLNRRP